MQGLQWTTHLWVFSKASIGLETVVVYQELEVCLSISIIVTSQAGTTLNLRENCVSNINTTGASSVPVLVNWGNLTYSTSTVSLSIGASLVNQLGATMTFSSTTNNLRIVAAAGANFFDNYGTVTVAVANPFTFTFWLVSFLLTSLGVKSQ